MDPAAILTAAEMLPRDHAAGVAAQLQKLDALVAELEACPPGAAEPGVKLHEAHVIAQSVFTESATHPNGGRPDRWFLTALDALNACARRHGLEQSHRPFTL